MQKTDHPPIESADKVLQLLELLAQRGSLRVSDAYQLLNVAPSTAHRLLAALVYRGLAIQDVRKAYRPGPALKRMLSGAPPALDLPALLRPVMERLHQAVRETCHLMVLEGNGVRFLDCIEGDHVLRVGTRTGMLLPAHVVSGGKALLAELSADEIRALYPRDLPAVPGGRAVQRRELSRELAAVRRRGYATNLEESERGIVAVARCVRDTRGRAIAALAVAVPSPRCPRSRIPTLNQSLREVLDGAEPVGPVQ